MSATWFWTEPETLKPHSFTDKETYGELSDRLGTTFGVRDARRGLRELGHPAGDANVPVWAATYDRAVIELAWEHLQRERRREHRHVSGSHDPHEVARWIGSPVGVEAPMDAQRRGTRAVGQRSLGTAKWIEAVFYALVSVNQGVAPLLSGRELGTPLASSRSPVPGRRRSRFPLAHDWFVRRRAHVLILPVRTTRLTPGRRVRNTRPGERAIRAVRLSEAAAPWNGIALSSVRLAIPLCNATGTVVRTEGRDFSGKRSQTRDGTTCNDPTRGGGREPGCPGPPAQIRTCALTHTAPTLGG